MSTNTWQQLTALGQSAWYDNVARPALADGLLERLVRDDHVTGGTSNPSIFAAAVADSDLYDEEIEGAGAELTAEAIYERMAVHDIQDACDVLRDVWERTGGDDGHISIEEEPALAHDADGAVARAHELVALIDRPNVMIKVPGTLAGVDAFERLTRAGVSVNVTLLFSRQRYAAVARAYVEGLTARAAAGEDVTGVRSVASFFVSRIDTAVDRLLHPESDLRGTIAVANATLAYTDVFRPEFTSQEWARLEALGARPQRPLWASTGVKDPDLPDTFYLERLIAPETVTTVPDAALDAFRDHGTAAATLLDGEDEARRRITELALTGIDLADVTQELEREGINRFADDFAATLAGIERRRSLVGGR